MYQQTKFNERMVIVKQGTALPVELSPATLLQGFKL